MGRFCGGHSMLCPYRLGLRIFNPYISMLYLTYNYSFMENQQNALEQKTLEGYFSDFNIEDPDLKMKIIPKDMGEMDALVIENK